ncbi:MAG: hypothetical protein OK452_04280 [Thaumarchaeota archaeon]|nr:hypothetical protein [Nitrososphaerota archaeon]
MTAHLSDDHKVPALTDQREDFSFEDYQRDVALADKLSEEAMTKVKQAHELSNEQALERRKQTEAEQSGKHARTVALAQQNALVYRTQQELALAKKQAKSERQTQKRISRAALIAANKEGLVPTATASAEINQFKFSKTTRKRKSKSKRRKRETARQRRQRLLRQLKKARAAKRARMLNRLRR